MVIPLKVEVVCFPNVGPILSSFSSACLEGSITHMRENSIPEINCIWVLEKYVSCGLLTQIAKIA